MNEARRGALHAPDIARFMSIPANHAVQGACNAPLRAGTDRESKARVTDQDEHTIKQHMGDIHRSFLGRDVATLNRILADDFSFSDPAGPIVGKEQWLADLSSGNLVFESIDGGPVEYQRAGEDTYQVSGETTIRVRYSRSNYNGTFRYKGIYRKHDGLWKLALASARAVDPGKLIREKK